MELTEHKSRRKYGQHFTSEDIFHKYIFPKISEILHDYVFVDLFCGSGNLILPILDYIEDSEKVRYFRNNMLLFDVQNDCIEETISNALNYGIPEDIAKERIKLRDTLKEYPSFITNLDKPIFHITNPPYLYLGYIAKNEETQKYLELFERQNEGYQDLYQIALINDLRNGIKRMIYIIPSNFIFGNSVSNKIREDFFKFYDIDYSYIFEKQIFEFTGTNVMINFFTRKKKPKINTIKFKGYKIKKKEEKSLEKEYQLHPENKYKAGYEFDDFINRYKSNKHLKLSYYLKLKEVEKNKGDNVVKVIDSNDYRGNEYNKVKLNLNEKLKEKIENNILWIRTVDTGSWEGRAGLYNIKETFGVSGILVSKNSYRTNPIQLFFKSKLSYQDQILLMNYFNIILEYLRKQADSEFMTTYKYSNGPYTRKYFGLSQCKKLIQTFPINQINSHQKKELIKLIESKSAKGIINFLNNIKSGKTAVKRKNRTKIDNWL